MKKRNSLLLIATVIVVAAVALWMGGGALWQLLLRMHGPLTQLRAFVSVSSVIGGCDAQTARYHSLHPGCAELTPCWAESGSRS